MNPYVRPAVVRRLRGVRAAEVGETATVFIVARYVIRTCERPFAWGWRGPAIGPHRRSRHPRYASFVAIGCIDEARETARSMRAIVAQLRVDPFISRYPIGDPARKEKLPR